VRVLYEIIIMKHYRHLFFDLDNTIWDFNRNSWYALQETFKKFNLNLKSFEVFFEAYNRHNDHLWELYRQNEITKQDLSGKRFELTFLETGIIGINGMDFNNSYLERMPYQTRLCDGAMEVLKKLSVKYKMHIITNGFSEVQHKKLSVSGIDRFFGKVILSEDINISKPSPGIFLHALKTCNAKKKESLMIGDSWEIDIIGAMEAGIDQVHYTPFRKNAEFTPAESAVIAKSGTKTYRINRLEDVFRIF
jgi:YjjG family noncanonical pyrimidine nucleotidase